MRRRGERAGVFVPEPPQAWYVADSSVTTGATESPWYWPSNGYFVTNSAVTTTPHWWRFPPPEINYAVLADEVATIRRHIPTPRQQQRMEESIRALEASQRPIFVPEGGRLNTPEEQAEIDRVRAAYRYERQRAKERAEVLLIENLSGQQLQEYRDRGTFTVAVPGPPPRLFQIQKARVANILELNAQGRPIGRYCVHPSLDCPDADTMLAQKLWLENQPEELLRMANRHPI